MFSCVSEHLLNGLHGVLTLSYIESTQRRCQGETEKANIPPPRRNLRTFKTPPAFSSQCLLLGDGGRGGRGSPLLADGCWDRRGEAGVTDVEVTRVPMRVPLSESTISERSCVFSTSPQDFFPPRSSPTTPQTSHHFKEKFAS